MTNSPDVWLTRYTLNNATTPEQVAKLPRRRDDFHRTVMSLFGEPLARAVRAEKGILWRLEDNGPMPYLLIQSTVPPTDHAASLPHIKVVTVTGLDTKFTIGSTLQYRIAMDSRHRIRAPRPVAAVKRDSDPRGRSTETVASDTDNRQRWRDRALRAGLRIDATSCQQRRVNVRDRTRNPALFPYDVFDGTATVTDIGALIQAIRTGIGSGRAWGCGLLTVARANHE